MSGSPQSSINNCESVLNKISNLYCNRLLSDVILKVGLQEYPAHRLILCASSAVFQVMLLKPEWSESCEQVVVLHEAEECEQQFGTFLQYLYTGRVVLTDATVLPILALADKYNVQDLRVVCGSYMKQHVVSAAEHNFLLSWLQYCLASQHTAAATACLNHFKWNFEQVARTSDFLNCDVGLLTSVLAQHDLVVHDEMTLYMYLVQWLEMQKHRLLAESDSAASSHCASPAPPSCLIQPPLVKLHPKLQLKEEIKEESSQSSPSNFSLEKGCTQLVVMSFVRFPMMTPRQIAHLLPLPLTIQYKEFFITRMAVGVNFQSGEWWRLSEVMECKDESLRLMFVPRLYTAELWSAGLTVDNLPALPPYHSRTLFFSTPASVSEQQNDERLEWIVELYPKVDSWRLCFALNAGIKYATSEMISTWSLKVAHLLSMFDTVWPLN
ncbi:hypothetical protein HAZT_HAZT008290 [Hyalella azteca]|uniref:BTB domain-containing protein n=1 Tax=Hyalella azteca TaxID=294128 RepID=A0A6A0HC39_HYAAZ|nr:hypothetical protein HAZT_HAZT008290 [Hyalella azteca]